MIHSKSIFIILTISLWILVTLYWILSAQQIGKNHRGTEIFSFIKLICSALIIYLPLLSGGFIATRLFTTTFLSGLSGTVLCFGGILTMILARRHLGRNWSGNVIIQQGHSISRSGPYQYVRHPIYGGGLLAMFGSAILVGQIFGFIWVIFCVFGLNRKIDQEEKLLTEQFPEEYPLYKNQVKKLIPFLWSQRAHLLIVNSRQILPYIRICFTFSIRPGPRSTNAPHGPIIQLFGRHLIIKDFPDPLIR